MAEANQDQGSTIDVLKAVFGSGSSTTDDTTVADSSARSASPTTKSAKRSSTFKIVATRDSMVIPEAGHEKGWIRKASEKDDTAKQGEGWKSSAYVFLLFKS